MMIVVFYNIIFVQQNKRTKNYIYKTKNTSNNKLIDELITICTNRNIDSPIRKTKRDGYILEIETRLSEISYIFEFTSNNKSLVFDKLENKFNNEYNGRLKIKKMIDLPCCCTIDDAVAKDHLECLNKFIFHFKKEVIMKKFNSEQPKESVLLNMWERLCVPVEIYDFIFRELIYIF